MEHIDTAAAHGLADALRASWDELTAAIDASAGGWGDRTLESEDDEADAWSPRLAAWHVITGERMRTVYLRHIVDDAPSDPLDMLAGAGAGIPEFDDSTLRDQYRATKTPDEMRPILTRARDDSAALVSGLHDDQLALAAKRSAFMHEYLAGHGQSSGNDVRGVLLHGAVHLRDHARQLSPRGH